MFLLLIPVCRTSTLSEPYGLSRNVFIVLKNLTYCRYYFPPYSMTAEGVIKKTSSIWIADYCSTPGKVVRTLEVIGPNGFSSRPKIVVHLRF